MQNDLNVGTHLNVGTNSENFTSHKQKTDIYHEYIHEYLWMNDNITCENKAMFNKQLYEKGVKQIKDIVENRPKIYHSAANSDGHYGSSKQSFQLLNDICYCQLVMSCNSLPEWMATIKKEMLGEMKVMIEESLDIHSERTKALEATVTKHTTMFKHVQRDHKELSDRVNNLEMKSMRENIIISGLDESDTTGTESDDDLKQKIMTLLEEELSLDPECVRIIKCHRLPMPTRHKAHTKPRNVVVRVRDQSEVFTILNSYKKLKGRDPPININQQYRRETAERRRVLYPVFQLVRTKSLKVNLVQYRLYIEGSLYTVENVCSASISHLHYAGIPWTLFVS
jgi:hypothetical protein